MTTRTVHPIPEDDLLLNIAISTHALRMASRALDVARALGGLSGPTAPSKTLPARVVFERDEHGRVTSASIRSAGSLLSLRVERAEDGALLAADFDFEEVHHHGG